MKSLKSNTSSNKTSPNQVRTIYTKRGYTLIKKQFSEEELDNIRKDLMFAPYVPEDFGAKPKPFPVFLESDLKLYLPKHYGFEHFGEPDQIKINKGQDINLQFNGSLKPNQLPILDAFSKCCEPGPFSKNSLGGLISVPCGYGKSVLGLYIISLLKKKTLIVVHKEFLLNQWKGEISRFIPEARVGIIQGSKIDIENKDIVIGMLQSLSMKDYPLNTFDDFGLTIIDECHHIAAEVFSRALPKINSWYSLGLSATPNRSDGLSKIFHMYLGPMVYRISKRDDRKVRVNTIRFHDSNPSYCKEETSMFGKVCVPRMVTNIVNNGNRNILINCIIKRLVEEDRRILVLSDRRDHLKAIHDMVQQYTSVGYYVGGMKQKDLDISAQKTVILGTYPMSSEGLNIPELDTAVFTTSKSSIEQSIGRIVRKVHEKIPLAIDIVDEFSVFPRQYVKREKVYRKLNYDIYEMHVYADTKSTENTFNYALDKPYKKKEFNSRGKKLEIEDDLDDMTDDELDIENTNGKKTATTKSECFIEDDE